MAYNIDINDSLSIILSNNVMLPYDMYNAYCIRFENGNAVVQQLLNENVSIAVNPGHNILLIEGKDKYYGYLTSDILAYVNPINSDIKLQYNNRLYEDNELSIEYTGNQLKPITQLAIKNLDIQQNISKQTYVFHSDQSNQNINLTFDEYKTYECSYKNNINVGIATVDVSSTYLENTSEKSINFHITPHEIIFSDISNFNPYIEYIGKDDTHVDQINITFNGNTLSLGYDYEIAGSTEINGLNPIQFQIQGIGNFSGFVNLSCSVHGDVSNAMIYFSGNGNIISDLVFKFEKNQDIKPYNLDVKLYDIYLLSNQQFITQFYKDYDYYYPGRKEAYIEGRGPCKDSSQKFSYLISGDIADCEFMNQITSLVKYTGQEIKQISPLYYFGKTLTLDTDYVVSYSNDPNYFKTAGEKTITYNGTKNAYFGKKTSKYFIYTDDWTLIQRVGSDSYEAKYITKLTRESLGIASGSDSTLVSIIVGSAVTSTGPAPFANCLELVEVDLSRFPSDIELPEGCFEGCIKLKKVVFLE